MDIATMHFWGKTKYWWALIITGILMIPCGLWLWFQPALGYEVLSLLLGWLLILFGIVQLIVSGNVKQKVRGWGWWLAGGIIDILIGFILVGNLSFSEAVLPFFFAFTSPALLTVTMELLLELHLIFFLFFPEIFFMLIFLL